MNLKIPENRKEILEYLDQVDEDTFIDEFVIPFFSSQGYQVYRINSHGPGEHGKDIIFCRYIPAFFENEFVSVQAKAERVNTSNVSKFSDQLKRALKTKFASRSGKGELTPHYAVFLNARKHSNDAYTEFPQLVDSPHAKILSQENVCEIMMQSGIAPNHLIAQLSIEVSDIHNEEDKLVSKTLLGDNPAEADNLLNHRLKFIKDELSQKTKELVIDYIYDRWEKDRSWAGTVKPMKWFDLYFDFFSKNNSKYLLEIFQELASSTPSFEALPYTESVIRKIEPALLSPIETEFINLCASRSISYPKNKIEIVIEKLKEFKDSGLIKGSFNQALVDKVILHEKYRQSGNSKERKKVDEEIFNILYPDE